MKSALLNVENLHVDVESKRVIDGLNAQVGRGEVLVLIGPNGSGKSSLAMTLMGDSRYNVLANKQTNKTMILFEGKDLLTMTVDERSKAGLFVAWQIPATIPGLSVFTLCKSSLEARGEKIGKLTEFKQKLEMLAGRVGLSKDHVSRNVNDGFSGGERKRLELLQLLLIKPKLAILDEIDSGLDGGGVSVLLDIVAEMKHGGTSFILITHNKKMIENIVVDKTWEMKNGRLSTGL